MGLYKSEARSALQYMDMNLRACKLWQLQCDESHAAIVYY